MSASQNSAWSEEQGFQFPLLKHCLPFIKIQVGDKSPLVPIQTQETHRDISGVPTAHATQQGMFYSYLKPVLFIV